MAVSLSSLSYLPGIPVSNTIVLEKQFHKTTSISITFFSGTLETESLQSGSMFQKSLSTYG